MKIFELESMLGIPKPNGSCVPTPNSFPDSMVKMNNPRAKEMSAARSATSNLEMTSKCNNARELNCVLTKQSAEETRPKTWPQI